jgi:acetyltransferase-like isoleucine patch superfamily enzyme
LRKEHKPFIIKRIEQTFTNNYVRFIVRPQFDALGHTPFILNPSYLELAGNNIRAGKHLHIIADKHKPVKLSCWSSKQQQGEIAIGDHCLISPGVSITSAQSIIIEDNCMIAADVSITDSDWHGIYNRTRPFRCSASVHLKKNAWIGLRAIIGKGITIGENSVVAAGAVVVEDVADNVVVGGNPAKIIKQINPKRHILTREYLFQHDNETLSTYLNTQRELDKYLLHGNSLWHWLKTKILPSCND